MMQKKICMLGGFAVGKTSLVSRFVRSIFSDKYLTTVGVKIDKKPMAVDGQDVTLMLWDLYGQDDFQSVQETHLRGTAGYLLVVDGTRPATLDTARELQPRTRADRAARCRSWSSSTRPTWPPSGASTTAPWLPRSSGTPAVLRTSAKTGDGVEEAFVTLTRAILAR